MKKRNEKESLKPEITSGGCILKKLVVIALVIITTFAFGTTKEKNVFTFIAHMAGAGKSEYAIKLKVETQKDDPEIPENTAKLSWENNQKYASFDYVIKRGVNDSVVENFSQIFALPEEPIKVLNVSPVEKSNNKHDALNQWMTAYGQNLIEVTTVYIEDFNKEDGNDSYKTQLSEIDGKYKYDLIFFGTWDSNNSKDLTENSSNAVKTFIESKHGVIFGHDTIANIGTSGSLYHPNFVSLQTYVDIETQKEWNSTHNHDTHVKITKHGVFTTYPYKIGDVDTILEIPQSHNLGQVANGDIWLQFNNENALDHTGGKYQSNKNFYLTTSKKWNCAMIQTGHSSGKATEDEQQIIANLIFYLWYQNNTKNSPEMVDKTFEDIDAPTKPVETENGIDKDLDAKTATVTIQAEDKGTHYRWEIEGYDNSKSEEEAEESKITSNVIEKTRVTGIVKYQYIIDGSSDTVICKNDGKDPENCVKEEDLISIDKVSSEPDTTITLAIADIPIGDKLKTYLHVRAVDGAGNYGEQADILVHEDLAPEIEVTSITPIEWTKGDVTINATATDEDGIVVEFKEDTTAKARKTRAINTESSNLTLTEQVNGTYTLKATDNAKKSSTKDVTISNIDKESPTIDEFEINVETDINGVSTADVNVHLKDNISGIQKVILHCGSISKVLEEDTHPNDGIHYGIKNQTRNITITDAELDANNGMCSLEVIDFAGNTSSKDIELDASLTVIHRDHLHHEREALKTETKKGTVGERYTTTPADIPGYRYVAEAEPSNKEGIYTIAPQTVYYEYVKQYNINIQKVDSSDLTTEIGGTTPSVTGDEGSTHVVDAPSVSGYKAVGYYINDDSKNIISSTSVNQKLTGDVTITFVYDKLSTVKVIFENYDTNEEIGRKEVVYKNEEENQTYQFIADSIENYTLVGYKIDNGAYTEIEESKPYVEITMGTEPVTIIFYYKEHSQGIIVHYVDQYSGELLDFKVYNGNVNDTQDLEELKFNGYQLVKGVENNQAIFDEKVKNVYYYYLKEVTISIVGKDAITGEILYQDTKTGLEGKTETIKTKKDFKNSNQYRLQGSSTKEVTYDSQTKETVTFYYNRISGGVKIYYIDKDTGTILDSRTISGVEGQSYTTVQNTYENYDFVEVVGNPTGQMTVEEKVIKYYYTKKLGKIVIIYENASGEEISRTNYTGKVDESYNLELEHIYGYETIGVIEGSLSGSYLINDQVVRVLVEQLRSKITIKYVDEKGKELDREEYEDYVGNLLEMDLPKFKGYEIDGESNMSLEYIEEDQEITIKYKKNTQNPQTATSNIVSYAILGTISLMGMIITTKKKPKKD